MHDECDDKLEILPPSKGCLSTTRPSLVVAPVTPIFTSHALNLDQLLILNLVKPIL
jgi:hypothetical protein